MHPPIGRSLRVALFPLAGGNAYGMAKTVPWRSLVEQNACVVYCARAD